MEWDGDSFRVCMYHSAEPLVVIMVLAILHMTIFQYRKL